MKPNTEAFQQFTRQAWHQDAPTCPASSCLWLKEGDCTAFRFESGEVASQPCLAPGQCQYYSKEDKSK